MSRHSREVSNRRPVSGEVVVAWLALFAIWVILSGKFDAFHLGMGVLTVFGLIWLHRGLEPLRPVDGPLLRLVPLLIYFVWLFKEMILAAIFVAKVILRGEQHLEPQLVHFEAEQPTVLNAVIFGHSITLTPGTVTLDLKNNHYLVHALTNETAEGVLEGSMARRVARLSTDRPVAPPRKLPEPEDIELWT